jgi:hypothetical protein
MVAMVALIIKRKPVLFADIPIETPKKNAPQAAPAEAPSK